MSNSVQPFTFRIISRWLDFCSQLADIDYIEQHGFYASTLNEKSTVLDLGANQGNFSREITGKFNCFVYSVEPTPELFEKLPKNNKVHNFHGAITNKDAPIIFHLSGVSVASSTNPDFVAKYGDSNAITVEGITIETFLRRNEIKEIDLLKCDIEGAEFDLFNSISDDQLKNIKQLTVEFHDFASDVFDTKEVEKIKNRLRILGFSCITLSSRWGDNSDVLFINQHKCNIKATSKIGFLLLHCTCAALMFRQNLKQKKQ